MEEKEAAPVFEKPKDQKKIEKENNIFKLFYSFNKF